MGEFIVSVTPKEGKLSWPSVCACCGVANEADSPVFVADSQVTAVRTIISMSRYAVTHRTQTWPVPACRFCHSHYKDAKGVAASAGWGCLVWTAILSVSATALTLFMAS